ncbi:MAG: ABC transporter permease [Gammaproteobacteria bacterium]|nr:ABC transporter permease [Gammaproteobacteria bacterium]
MDIKPIYLWTDRLIFILVAGIIYLAAYIRRKPHLRTPWSYVFQSRRALISIVILSIYALLGLLDSIHYQKPLSSDNNETHYSVELFSSLDVVLGHLHERVEKTYSAPFASNLFAKETLADAEGKQYRDYPRLEYGGRHLDKPDEQLMSDIASKSLEGLANGLVTSIIIVLLVLLMIKTTRQKSMFLAWQGLRHSRSFYSLRIVLMTAVVLILMASTIWELSFYYHVFGTDKVGQDVLYLSIKSIRTGLVIGTLTTLVMLPFAILLGIMAGYFRGWVDDVIQYLYTTLSSIPGVLLIAAAILSIQVYMANHPELFESARDQADLRLLALCVVLGITGWTGLCRLLRGEVLKLREMDYIQAATAFGVGHFTIIGRHLLPNVLHIILIMVVLDFSGLVLAEAVLSYVQVGVDPSTISWGNMINGARLELAREPMVWWSLIAAFVFMFTMVLAANLFADAVRDAFDPRLNRSTT